jgi:hypothetical protein
VPIDVHVLEHRLLPLESVKQLKSQIIKKLFPKCFTKHEINYSI